ncbi:UDP-glycosyltransferase UGT5-like [Schistocerca cancellata]|uniref:UDP-glycosyltransferase UGT5-like n=1 Tax=Schistocerca cancellata TaxID=274614 RepID=UPI0021184E0E|nr:UDP-glycosyltransferase UGT5-like [Schistocerca cancellata]XP_049787184.1 UDP-glycosyltransferase UGT5-like [Schistocerca cancellata]XP_049787185.1 UDP-glycosyltransferase UGT5-like [Schistocerca cancellata]XP_049787186.1 UDP-glycosyltransferase UGT5-like [Schistocerca cancellata]XP_049787187.1 UDP-glycosyltransferase UGT5-like [Schistocerca cancellata]
MRHTLLVAVLLLGRLGSQGANILAPIWFSAPSHFVMFDRLLSELAARGHNVTVLSYFPRKAPLHNYHDIALHRDEWHHLGGMSVDVIPVLRSITVGYAYGWMGNVEGCREAFSQPQTRELVRSADRYDLVITDIHFADCTVAFAHHLGVPLINVATSFPFAWTHDRVGNPDHPAYTELFNSEAVAPFTFWQRLKHSVAHVYTRLGNRWLSDWQVDAVVREAFGPGVPPTHDLVRNASLVLLNTHWSIDQVIPKVPALVEVAGLHVADPKPLPQDIQKFMDDSPAGVVYFCLGSKFRPDSFAPEKLQAVLDTFSRLEQRVLWKVDASSLPSLPDNVKTAAWVPQNDVLNHPNTRVFITHAGQMSMVETTMAAVPVLAIPFGGDQVANAARAARRGTGLLLEYQDLTYDTFSSGLDALLNDARYRERAKQVSQLFRDRPRPPMEEAIYWVEYVIRHRGAPHLRSAALDLVWYQYLLLDVAAFVVAAVVFSVALLFFGVRALLRCCTPRRVPANKKKTK